MYYILIFTAPFTLVGLWVVFKHARSEIAKAVNRRRYRRGKVCGACIAFEGVLPNCEEGIATFGLCFFNQNPPPPKGLRIKVLSTYSCHRFVARDTYPRDKCMTEAMPVERDWRGYPGRPRKIKKQ